jgi:glucose-1-phosphate cytidylyltransferase
VHEFHEKVVGEDEWINGVYFVIKPAVLDYIAGNDTRFEHDTLTRLAREASSWRTVTMSSGSAWTRCARRRS